MAAALRTKCKLQILGGNSDTQEASATPGALFSKADKYRINLNKLVAGSSRNKNAERVFPWSSDLGDIHACDSFVADGSSYHRHCVAVFDFLTALV